MYEELIAGYRVDPDWLINDAIFDVAYSEMAIVRDIDYYSFCASITICPLWGACMWLTSPMAS